MSEVYKNSIRLLSLFSQLKQEMVVILNLKKQSNWLDNLMNINTATILAELFLFWSLQKQKIVAFKAKSDLY
jgi:hypothetical protein